MDGASGAGHRVGPGDPAHRSGRAADGEPAGGNVPGDEGARADDGALADRDPGMTVTFAPSQTRSPMTMGSPYSAPPTCPSG